MRPERMKAEKILNDFFDTFKKDPYASDSSDGEKEGLNAKFSPIDEQTNEKLLKKVEEFKKEDLKVDYTIKNSSNVVKEKQQDNVWSEIAYKNVSNGKLCVAKISSSLMLDSLLNLIPEDAWMTLFTETQRDQLRLLLPKMEEVEGLSKDELQQENLRLLFTGANFHFGNQLVRFNQEIQQGKRRLQVYQQRILEQERQYAHFCHHQNEFRQKLLKDIKRHKRELRYLEVEELPLTIPYFKRPRFEKIEAEYKQKEITKENSFFLGIKKAFEATKMDKTVEDVWNFLEKNHPQRIPDQKEIVLLISQKDFLHAALLFLSNPFGKRKCSINQKQFSSVWQREYLEYNENKKTFKWKETTTTKQQIELETVCLMGLELIFRQPPKLDPTTLYGKKAFAIKQVERRMRQRILPEVLATLREKFPIEFEKMEEIVHRPPINLCAWMEPCHASIGWENVSTYHTQEKERYANPFSSFTYKDESRNLQVQVAPVWSEPRSEFEQSLLVQDAPKEVSMVNLVSDALHLLPKGYGTRTDLKQMVSLSQYLLVETSAGTCSSITNFQIVLEQAIVEALNTLDTRLNGAQFDPVKSVWTWM